MPVLVVDDHETTREGLVHLLRHAGFQAIAAPDGYAALKILSDCLPRIVILDLMMPGMSGLDVLREIRADERLATVPVIAFSAAEYEGAKALEAGANIFLLKGTVGWAEMIQAIKRLTARDVEQRAAKIESEEEAARFPGVSPERPATSEPDKISEKPR